MAHAFFQMGNLDLYMLKYIYTCTHTYVQIHLKAEVGFLGEVGTSKRGSREKSGQVNMHVYENSIIKLIIVH